MFPYSYILTFLRSKLLVTYCLCDSAYPSSYGFTGFISSASCILILTQYKSSFSTCTILFIRSVTNTKNSQQQQRNRIYRLSLLSKYIPNRLTLLYSKIYYKEKNYLKVKTVVFKYITSPIVKVKYIGMLVYQYIPIFLYSHILTF